MIRLGCLSPSVHWLYDAAGNMTGDNTYTYAYNAESEIKSAAGVNYVYDAEGNRAGGPPFRGGFAFEVSGAALFAVFAKGADFVLLMRHKALP